MVAILPAAGKGTRMSMVTGGRAKELLSIGGKPVLAWALDEAAGAGITRSIVVISPDKPELLDFLAGRAEVATQVRPNGHGAAVSIPDIEEAIVVLNPDTLYFPRSPLSRLVSELAHGTDVVIVVEPVADERVSKYGIVEWDEGSGRIGRILEKPNLGDTESRWAVAGRFGMSARTFAFLKKQVADADLGQDIGLTPVLGSAIASGYTGVAIPLDPGEQRLDCGSPEGYQRALTLCR